MRRIANEAMVDLALRYGAGPFDTLQFLCECGSPDCNLIVLLTTGEFDELRSQNRPLQADHPLLDRARETRLRARAARLESAAVKAQAELQLERTRRARQP